MKEYWLVLDAYVFIWGNFEESLIYNSLSGKGFTVKKTKMLRPVLSGLEDKSNMYCVSLQASALNNSEMGCLILKLREYFCGDLLDKSIYPQRPFIVIPELNIDEETFRKNHEINQNDRLSGIHALKNLMEMDVYLTGNCYGKCADCSDTFKQISWCCQQKGTLPINSLTILLDKVKQTAVNKLNFFGGNIFLYPHWDELINVLSKYTFIKNFYIHYQTLLTDLSKLRSLENNHFKICVLVDLPLDENINPDVLFFRTGVDYTFRITSLEEYSCVQELIDKNELTAKIIPYYTGKNLSFFNEYVFQNKEDIVDTPWTKNEIFAHMTFNTFDFGKLTIFPDGKIFSNVNFPAIGNIYKDDVFSLINGELQHSKTWFRTRDSIAPCNECLLKYLCPSPSNYEIIIGMHNLCKLM